MKCPKCQTENPDSRKFCRKCGTKLLLICSDCDFENLPGDEFCGGCGRAIAVPPKPISKDLSFDEKLSKIQKYLPGGLTEKILAQRGKIEGERKQVTVLFCDMENFTPLVEKLGHEEAFTLMDKVYEILIHKVHEFEGTVNDLSGDGMMALFGAPIALEDAPQRSIRSALAIHREITQFSDRIKQEKGIPAIRMRVGIHTGPVVVGALGNDLRVQFTAVGDTVNLASRVQNLADPGTTYVTEDTFKLTEGFFLFEALGEKKIKGKEEPVKVYQVIAPSTRRTKFDVSTERGLTPFIGRERELELLLDGFQRVKAGKGQAFSIISEAGAGKSRLLYEFRKAVANEDIFFLEGKCLSYSRGVAYHPIIDILRSNFYIVEGEKDQEVKDKIRKGLGLMGADEASTIPYLLELLSVRDSGIDQIPMTPEARKDRTIEALRQIVLKGSEVKPLIIALEDLHWLDKNSEHVVKDLLDKISGSRVLLIFSYRPEFVPSWGSKPNHSQITLHRLSNRESLEMATYLLSTKEIERTLKELILEKTEGIPFFIEEFIKSLMDLKIVDEKENVYHLSKDIHSMTIPLTIQDVIMARVDSLPEKAKEVLQIGSVIEREFSYSLINRVMNLPEKELFSYLCILKDSELLYEGGLSPQPSYIFKHALTREVVYDSILTRRKRKLHEEIGNAIEQLHKDNLSEHYEVLSAHYFLGDNHLKSAEYSRFASKKAEKAASLNDAIMYSRKRVTSLEKLAQTEDVRRQIIDGRTVLGLYLTQLNYHIQAKEAIDPITDLAIRHGDKKRLCQINTTLGSYHLFVEENFPRAFKDFGEALKISEEIRDMTTSFFASYWLGLALAWNCEFERSADHLQRALEVNLAAKNLWGIAFAKSTLAYYPYHCYGKIELQFKTTEEAIHIAEESGDIYSKAATYVSHGVSCYGKALLQEAEKHLLNGLELSEKINFPFAHAVGRFHLGETYFEMRDFLRSKEQYEKGSWGLDNGRLWPSWANGGKIGLARSKVMNKEKDVSLESLYVHCRNNKVKAFEGWIQRYIGEILLNIDDLHTSEAEHFIQNAIEADQRNRMMFHLGKDYALYGEFFKRRGDRLRTQETLSKAIEILRKCGADGWVEKYEKELAALS